MHPALGILLPLFLAFSTQIQAASALNPIEAFPQPEPPGPSSRRTGMTISEIMYHPLKRADGLEIQYVELFNALPWFEDLSGWSIRGDVSFTFPTNTLLPGRSFLVIAVNPADLRAVYGMTTNAFGPFENGRHLDKKSGRLELWNKNGARCLEVRYASDGPWPAAADGTGHSLVLARPSFGERDPSAWAASAEPGGSPGEAEPPLENASRVIRINEFLASTQPPQHDFVELYNYSDAPVELSGWTLSDDPEVRTFRFATNDVIAARGYFAIDEDQLGFRLSADGERLILRDASGRVVEALAYTDQQRGVSQGSYPDGSSKMHRLSSPTPGAANTPPLLAPVVINEIFYHPPSNDDADEFLELHNWTEEPVDIGNWRLSDGIEFTIPPGTHLAAGGFAVVAKSVERLKQNHPGLQPSQTLGAYQGSLANSGERIALAAPEWVFMTNEVGVVSSNRHWVLMDQVHYGTGGRWGKWSDGGGSSLERIDPRADGDLATSWADSDESRKSPWVTVEATGRLDNGNGSATPLQVLSFGPGEFLMDNVEVFTAGGTNRVMNSTFEAGTASWAMQGNHNGSTLETTEGDGSAQSLHVRATGAGNTGANRLYARLWSALSANQTATLRARVRWLKGSPNMLLRLHGNWLEAPGSILAANNLGTPGSKNTARIPNAPPAITGVSHFPIVPAVGQSVRVRARISDTDGVARVMLKYRRDTVTNAFEELSMENNGAGWYSAVIPPQSTGAMVAFHIVAEDAAPAAATSLFPASAPDRECLVRWGEASGNVPLGPYRIWATRQTISKWVRREKLSNDPLDTTFVCGNYRVIYNAGAQYSGSPYHAPSYDTPTGANCDYLAVMPPDDVFLGDLELNLLQPGNGGGDGTCQQEQHAYWIARELGLPYSHRRPVQLFVNGIRRGTVYEDAQQPNSDYVEQWFPDDPDGDLHKIQLWFEFELDASTFQPISANLGRYVTLGNQKKLARYRWNWAKRSYGNDPNDYTELFKLVDAVNVGGTGDRYFRTLDHAVDVNNWFRTHITEHIVGNNDSYSYGGGQNMYSYRPTRGPWRLMIWDIDFAFASQGPTSDLFTIGGASVGPRNDLPQFSRLYWQGLIDAAQGALTAERSNPIIDSRYNGMRLNGASVSSGASIKTFISQRRNYILGLVRSNTAPLRITTNGGNALTNDLNLVTLAGTAPLEMKELLVNGVPVPLTWTSRTAWTTKVMVEPGTNTLVLTGRDFRGQLLTNDPVAIGVTSTAAEESPVGRVIFSELMHHPPRIGAGFVELRNTSATAAFDLSGWEIEGLDFTFPAGARIDPGGFVVVVEDGFQFGETFGGSVKYDAVYAGRLSPNGETLRLFRPADGASPALLVDSLTYRTTPPWAPAANNGSSLQLIDAAQDNNRPGNWAAATTNAVGATWQRIVATGKPSSSTLYLYLQTAGDAYIDDLKLVHGDDPDVGPNLIPNGDFESAFPGAFGVSPNHSGSGRVTEVHHSGSAALQLVASEPGSTRASSIFIDLVPALVTDDNYTLSFWCLPGAAPVTLTSRLSGSGISATVDLDPNAAAANQSQQTPGAENSVAAALPPMPPLWINEVQAVNLTGIIDNYGEREAWLEIYNGGSTAATLDGMFLSDDPTKPRKWGFPAGSVLDPKQMALVWLDGQQDQGTAVHWHASFKADPDAGLVLLSMATGNTSLVLDSVKYVPSFGERTVGYIPDGDVDNFHPLGQATPKAPNTLAVPRYNLFINEWMSDNTSFLRDAADQDYEDWFEVYNASGVEIDLGGFLLSDSRTNPAPFEIPMGFKIPSKGRLLVWADGEPGQNTGSPGDLHVSFKLSASGESIVLRAPDGTLIDAVDFGAQAANQSDGRFPDGGSHIGTQPEPSPGTANSNSFPTVLSIHAGAGGTQLIWEAVPGQRYVVEFAPTLSTDATFHDIAGPLQAQGERLQIVLDPEPAIEGYYRVRQLPSP